MRFIGRSRWATASLVSGLLLGAPRVLAQPSPAPAPRAQPPLRLLWTSEDPDCDGDTVAARSLALVTPGVAPRPLVAKVEVRRDGQRWQVELETQSGGQTGRRSLRAESCDELEGALALLLAMTLESGGEPPAAAPEPARAPVPTPEPPGPSLAELAEDTDEPAAPAAPAPGAPGLYRGLFFRLSGAAGDGQQPGLALGVGAAVGVRLGDFELGVAGTHWPSTERGLPAFDARVSLRRENLGLRACWNAWQAGAWSFAPCLSPSLTLYHLESTGLVLNRTRSVPPSAALGASAELRYALLGGALALSLGAGLNVEQPRPFVVNPIIDEDDAEDENTPPPPPLEVYNTRAIGPRLEIGVDARF